MLRAPLAPDFVRSIELLYQAIEDERCWSEFLQFLLEQLELTAITLHISYARGGAFIINHCAGISRKEFRDAFADRPHLAQYSMGHFIDSMAGDPDEDVHRLHFRAGVVLARSAFQYATLGFGRALPRGPFTQAWILWVEALIPHLMRAVNIHGRMARLRVDRDYLAACLAGADAGIVLATCEGEVLAASSLADLILNQGAGLRREAGRLRALCEADQSRLEAALRRAASGGSEIHGGMLSLAISRRPALPLLLHIAPVDPHSRHGAGAANQVTVWMIDMARQVPLDPEALQEMFGLTRSEARLCVELVSGHSVKDLAKLWNVSIATLRTHLSHALAKTGLRRQSELVVFTLRAATITRIGARASVDKIDIRPADTVEF